MLIEGVEHTPVIRGLINFSDLRSAVHKDAIIEELRLRFGGPIAEKDRNWNGLRQLMRKAEGIPNDVKKTFFKPMTEAMKAFLPNAASETSTPLV